MKRMWSKNELKTQINEQAASGNIPSVKANEIIENMSGYTYGSYSDDEQCKVTPIYAGIVKNGNKLSFVVFGRIKRLDTISARKSFGAFGVPSAILDKLVPTTLFGEQLLMAENAPVTKETDGSSQGILLVVKKTSDGFDILIGQSSANNLTANVDYLFRFEKTFMLSENMVSEQL